MSNENKIPVGILGATGTVGQRFIQLFENHPNFYVAAVGASPRSAGKPYSIAASKSWKMNTSIPVFISSMIVTECLPIHFKHCKIVFSGLDSDVAGDIELNFFKNDFGVFSNAKNHRMGDTIPLVVPVVNADHLDLIHHQRTVFPGGLSNGFLVTNANCSTTGLVVPLKALIDKFGPISKVMVTTMQAISGAGYPGVPSLDILGNVVPYISGEEEKMEIECSKILGSMNSNKSGFIDAEGMKVSATCNRVAVIDGHTESVNIEFASGIQPEIKSVIQVLNSYTCEAQKLKCFSAPIQAIKVFEELDRPQPRLDIMLGGGNSVSIGRVRECNIFHIKFTVLSHNTILGAAGSSIMNAEIALAKGLVKRN